MVYGVFRVFVGFRTLFNLKITLERIKLAFSRVFSA